MNGEWELQYGRQVVRASGMEQPEIPDAWTRVSAQVPGNVELDLVRAGLLPEQLEKGHNIYLLRELETMQWWYTKTFTWEAESGADRYELVLEGADTIATYWLNGVQIGQTENMLIPHRIDVTDHLRSGENQLVIGIDSTVLAAQEEPVEAGAWAMENNWESLSIRKAAHGFGWDIMPRVVSAGLWRDVYLESVPATRFSDVYLATPAVDADKRSAHFVARWNIKSEAWPIDDWSVRLAIFELDNEQSVVTQKTVPILSTHGFTQCELENIDLWWPRGYGDAALYNIRLDLLDGGGNSVAQWQTHYGFRTIKLQMTDTLSKEGDGEFVFVVNGKKIFAKGSNWVPLDAFHSRDSGHLQKTLDLVADLNCNMIRCWGGNVYESNAFFERCDREGVMIWQDFAFGCALYPQSSAFHEKVRAEAEAIIPLLRNHPSLALWAGNNEIDVFYTFAKPTHDPNEDDLISRQVLASACRRLDPWRDYLPSSPYISPELWKLGAPHDQRPEDHLWGPRDDFKGPFYTSSNAHFVSEIGYHGCPSRSSLEAMMTPENLWPWQENEEWLTHAVRPQLRGTAYNYRIELMANQIKVLFGEVPDNLNDFIFASQVSQAEALKYFIERFRINREKRSGILWWNVRDGWPQISDAVVDYYGAKKLAYKVIKRIQENTCVMLDELSNGMHRVVAVNDTFATVSVEVSVVHNGVQLLKESAEIPSNEKVILGTVPGSDEASFYQIEWIQNGRSCHNHYLAGPRPFEVNACRAWYASENIQESEHANMF